MLFANKRGSRVRRRRRTRNRPSTYTLNLGGRSAKRATRSAMPRVALTLLCLAMAALLCWLAFRTASARLFSRNPMYQIANLEIDSTSSVVNEFIRGELNIRAGGNLFGFDIQNARETFLKFAPNFRSMEITRVLPDTLKVSLVERQPVAQIGQRGGYAVDIEKRVFNKRNRKQQLPVIFGYKGPILKPGDRVVGLAADAIAVIDAIAGVDPAGVIDVLGIDVGGHNDARPDALRLYLEGDITVDLWWKRTKEGTRHDDLRSRLSDLVAMIERSADAKKLKVITLITDDSTKNAVTYWD